MIFFEHATFFIFGLAFSHMYEKNWYFRCCYSNVSICLWEFYEKGDGFSQKAMDIFFILSDKKIVYFYIFNTKTTKNTMLFSSHNYLFYML